MKRCQLTILPTVVLTLVGLLAPNRLAHAQSPGYQSPNFYAASQAGGGQFRPPYPASPLAGGPSAAQGDAFMDAQGRPIVMPASYSQNCPGGNGCYGDPMAVDFGGCAQDQCGPHYFDVAIDTIFLQSNDLYGDGALPFSSEGVGGNPPPPNTINPRLDPQGQSEDYEPGWRIALRYDLGPLSVFEATYMGIYDFGFDLTANATDNLFSVFSQYGIAPDPADGVAGIAGLDGADEQNLNYESDLQSTELTFRRYWVGNHPRISGTWMAGARYVRMTEDLAFSAYNRPEFDTPPGPVGSPKVLTGQVTYASENDLVGFQFGGDVWTCLRQGLRFGLEGKSGIYNNRYKFDSTNFASVDPENPQLPEDGNQIAFVAEGGISFVADIMPSWSVRGGYHVFYMNSLVALQNNVATTQYFTGVPIGTNPETLAPALNTQGHALYHGFTGGVEYVW